MSGEPRPDLELFGIYDRGIPNKERIALKVNARVNTGDYALILGVAGANGTILPARDQFLWLGRTIVDIGWVFVFTGPGDPVVTTEVNTKEPMHAIYWGKPNVMFTIPEARAALVRLGPIQVWTRDQTIDEYRARKIPPREPSLLELLADRDKGTTSIGELLEQMNRSNRSRSDIGLESLGTKPKKP